MRARSTFGWRNIGRGAGSRTSTRMRGRSRWTGSIRSTCRNHKIEAALEAANQGEMEPFDRLLDAVTRPFDARPGLEEFEEPAPADFGPYTTFCGT